MEKRRFRGFQHMRKGKKQRKSELEQTAAVGKLEKEKADAGVARFLSEEQKIKTEWDAE